jgi:4-amino-4-deoxy-L-arabinose transferase-like glycosyltransferase
MSLLLNPIAVASQNPKQAFPAAAAKSNRLPTWLAISILLAWSGLLFFYGITTGELCRTEGLRAILGQEMLRSGNWIVPTLYGQPMLTKPPGMYVAIALASWPAGTVTEWSARLPSAVAGVVTVLLVFWYFSRCLGRWAGLVAGAITPASLMWLDKVPAAEIDMLQVAWVTAAILFLMRALELTEHSAGWWTASLVCVAGGFLTKWTAPAFFYGAAVPLLFWRRQLRLLFAPAHLLGATLAAAVCLAWVALVLARTGWNTFTETVGREALQHLSPAHHIRPYPWSETLTHPFRVLAASLPWSIFALLTLRPGFAQRWSGHSRALLQALHFWTWPNLLFWSLVPEHSPRHSFPLFPGLAGLAAFVWIAWLRDAAAARRSSVLVALLAAWLLVKLAFIHWVIPARNLGREPKEKAALIAECVPLGQTLYLFRLKDDGLIFYYGRPVQRVDGPDLLPAGDEPVYCILDATEWRHWDSPRHAEPVRPLEDQQGSPIMLVRVTARARGP